MGDDVVYSSIAADRLSGTVHFLNVHQTRAGFLLPILASYSLFGPGEVPLVLYNLLCSVALVAALFALARRLFGDAAATAAGALAALHPNLVRFSTEGHTDTPVALWLTLAAALLLAAESSSKPRPRLVLAGLLVGWAWLHKEHAVFFFPFVAAHAWVMRRRWTWCLPVALPCLGVLVAELAGYALLTGDPLRRFRMVGTWHVGYMAEQYPTAGSVLYRLTLDLPLRLLAPWNGLLFPSGLAAGLWLGVRRVAGARWVGAWFLVLYLGYSFWPSSLVPFRPGFGLFQWTLPVLWPPLVLLLAGALARLPRRPEIASLVALSALHLAAIHGTWLHDRRFPEGAREARDWIRRENPARVFADDRTVEALVFFDGHDPARRYFRLQDAEPAACGVVIVDRLRTEPGRWGSRLLREEVRRAPPEWRKVYESARLTIYKT